MLSLGGANLRNLVDLGGDKLYYYLVVFYTAEQYNCIIKRYLW